MQQITVYGCDVEAAGAIDITREKYPLKTDVEGLPGVVSFTIGVKRVGAKPLIEKTTRTYLNDYKLDSDYIRFTFAPEQPLSEGLNDWTTNLEDRFGLEIPPMNFKWLYIGDYQPAPAAYDNTKCIAVNMDIDTVDNDEFNSKTLNYNFSERGRG